jgi:hypothetical protein
VGDRPHLPIHARRHQDRGSAPAGRRPRGRLDQILAEGCHQYGDICRWDGGATYNYKFSASQVSILDFFHPDLDGQAALARVTWAASWWPTI